MVEHRRAFGRRDVPRHREQIGHRLDTRDRTNPRRPRQRRHPKRDAGQQASEAGCGPAGTRSRSSVAWFLFIDSRVFHTEHRVADLLVVVLDANAPGRSAGLPRGETPSMKRCPLMAHQGTAGKFRAGVDADDFAVVAAGEFLWRGGGEQLRTPSPNHCNMRWLNRIAAAFPETKAAVWMRCHKRLNTNRQGIGPRVSTSRNDGGMPSSLTMPSGAGRNSACKIK